MQRLKMIAFQLALFTGFGLAGQAYSIPMQLPSSIASQDWATPIHSQNYYGGYQGRRHRGHGYYSGNRYRSYGRSHRRSHRGYSYYRNYSGYGYSNRRFHYSYGGHGYYGRYHRDPTSRPGFNR